MKLSIVIPARNESRNIGSTVDAVVARCTDAGFPYELLVVDDGSSDATSAEVNRRRDGNASIRLITNTGPHGFGYAIRCGLDHYTGDAVVIMMADCSDSPDDLITYYRVLSEQAECAFGSRWIHSSVVTDYPAFKKPINRLVNNLLMILFGIRYNDITNAFKGYRRSVIDGCRPLISPHFNLTVELPLKAIVRGYSYVVVPISWRNRMIGTSALKLHEMGSRYLFIVLYVLLEKLLTRDDYHRRDR